MELPYVTDITRGDGSTVKGYYKHTINLKSGRSEVGLSHLSDVATSIQNGWIIMHVGLIVALSEVESIRTEVVYLKNDNYPIG